MSWQQWFLAGFFALNILVTIGYIGQERKPLTPGAAVFVTLFNVGLIALVVTA